MQNARSITDSMHLLPISRAQVKKAVWQYAAEERAKDLVALRSNFAKQNILPGDF